MKKKVLSLVMAVAMTLTLAAPAFAANYYTKGTASDQMEQSLTFNALTFVPTVSLSMPTLGNPPVVLNPYKIAFTGSSNKLSGQSVANTTDQYKQVICPVYTIENKTDAALKYAIETTTTATGLTLVDSPVAISETEKNADLQLVVGTREFASSEITNYGNPAQEQLLDRFDVSKFETIQLASGEAVASDEGIEKVLAPGNSTANYLVFQFQGDMTRSPETAWTAADKVDCIVKFTFTPDSANDYTVSAAIDKHSPVIDNDSDGNPTGSAITVKLPTIDSGAEVTTANMTAQGAPTVTFAAEPNWKIVSSGALVKSGLSIDNDTLSIDPTTACVRLPHDGASAAGKDYKIVLSFNDEHNIPRTVDFKVKLARS